MIEYSPKNARCIVIDADSRVFLDENVNSMEDKGIVFNSRQHEGTDNDASWLSFLGNRVRGNFLGRAVPNYLPVKMCVPPQPAAKNCRVLETRLGGVP